MVRRRRRTSRSRPHRREHAPLLAGLFEFRVARADDADQGERIRALRVKLGGDPEVVFYGRRSTMTMNGMSRYLSIPPTRPTEADGTLQIAGNLAAGNGRAFSRPVLGQLMRRRAQRSF